MKFVFLLVLCAFTVQAQNTEISAINEQIAKISAKNTSLEKSKAENEEYAKKLANMVAKEQQDYNKAERELSKCYNKKDLTHTQKTADCGEVLAWAARENNELNDVQKESDRANKLVGSLWAEANLNKWKAGELSKKASALQEKEKANAEALKAEEKALNLRIDTLDLALDFSLVKDKYEDLDQALDALDDKYDRSIQGAYIYSKLSKLLASDALCEAQNECSKPKENRKKNFDLNEVFPKSGDVFSRPQPAAVPAAPTSDSAGAQ